MIENADKSMAESLMKLTTQLHYLPQPPRIIKVGYVGCEDQIRYFTEFLATMPYTERRPHRFIYEVLTEKQVRKSKIKKEKKKKKKKRKEKKKEI